MHQEINHVKELAKLEDDKEFLQKLINLFHHKEIIEVNDYFNKIRIFIESEWPLSYINSCMIEVLDKYLSTKDSDLKKSEKELVSYMKESLKKLFINYPKY